MNFLEELKKYFIKKDVHKYITLAVGEGQGFGEHRQVMEKIIECIIYEYDYQNGTRTNVSKFFDELTEWNPETHYEDIEYQCDEHTGDWDQAICDEDCESRYEVKVWKPIRPYTKIRSNYETKETT
jgi:hypothetical protein